MVLYNVWFFYVTIVQIQINVKQNKKTHIDNVEMFSYSFRLFLTNRGRYMGRTFLLVSYYTH